MRRRPDQPDRLEWVSELSMEVPGYLVLECVLCRRVCMYAGVRAFARIHTAFSPTVTINRAMYLLFLSKLRKTYVIVLCHKLYNSLSASVCSFFIVHIYGDYCAYPYLAANPACCDQLHGQNAFYT